MVVSSTDETVAKAKKQNVAPSKTKRFRKQENPSAGLYSGRTQKNAGEKTAMSNCKMKALLNNTRRNFSLITLVGFVEHERHSKQYCSSDVLCYLF